MFMFFFKIKYNLKMGKRDSGKTCILNVKVSLPLEPTPSKAEPKDKVKVLPTEVMLTIIGQSSDVDYHVDRLC